MSRIIWKAVALALVFSLVVSQSCKLNKDVETFKQCDPKWANQRLGSSSTICMYGCLVCSVAAGLKAFGLTVDGKTPDCSSLNTYMIENRAYFGNMFKWAQAERFGVRYQGLSENVEDMKKALCGQKLVMLNVDNGNHWVMAVEVVGNTWTVVNPGPNKLTYESSEIKRGGIYKLA